MISQLAGFVKELLSHPAISDSRQEETTDSGISGFIQISLGGVGFYLISFILLDWFLWVLLSSDLDGLSHFLKLHNLDKCLLRLKEMQVTDMNILRKLSRNDLKIARFEPCDYEKLWQALHCANVENKISETLQVKEEMVGVEMEHQNKEHDASKSKIASSRKDKKKQKKMEKKTNQAEGKSFSSHKTSDREQLRSQEKLGSIKSPNHFGNQSRFLEFFAQICVGTLIDAHLFLLPRSTGSETVQRMLKVQALNLKRSGL
jgi:hypothetical protein